MFEKIQDWDERWVCRINNQQFGRIFHFIFSYFTHIGSVIPWIVVCVILIFLDQDLLAIIIGSGLIEFGIIQFLIKIVIRRKRPYKNEKIKDKIVNRDFLLRNGGPSLPSGHTSAFTLTSLILVYYFNNPYLLIITLAGVTFVSYSRIYLGAHYPTDTFVGIVFGVLLYFLVIFTLPTTLYFIQQIKELFFL